MADTIIPPSTKAIPQSIELNNLALVYHAASASWVASYQSVFRPAGDYAPININNLGFNTIIKGLENKSIRIISIFFTVAGECNLMFYDGRKMISGPMDFGGTSEPRGIVIPFSFSPLELTMGNDFRINLSNAVQVSGMACYYYQ